MAFCCLDKLLVCLVHHERQLTQEKKEGRKAPPWHKKIIPMRKIKKAKVFAPGDEERMSLRALILEKPRHSMRRGSDVIKRTFR